MITGTLETIDGAENIVLTRDVPAPIEKVWDAFTVSDQLACGSVRGAETRSPVRWRSAWPSRKRQDRNRT
ncbi:hypothetical protein [Kocuria atrinae]|uniref:hypothetical protein n=1 Tax=Kocuria atrinae TaxID=592377 RepID=UPI0003168A96|nr:hypothetical protein [Kocuria atrinae]